MVFGCSVMVYGCKCVRHLEQSQYMKRYSAFKGVVKVIGRICNRLLNEKEVKTVLVFI